MLHFLFSYPPDFRNSNNTLCVSSLLLSVQDQIGRNLSLSPAFSSMMGVNISPGLGCTGCVQGALRILQQEQPAIANNQSFQNAVSSQCGSNFLSMSSAIYVNMHLPIPFTLQALLRLLMLLTVQVVLHQPVLFQLGRTPT